MSIRKKTGSFLVMAFAWSQLCAQQNQNEFNANTIPPSPQAASLGKYVEIPIGLNTGTPEISIPITEVRQGKLNLPVSLSYHAAANRVSEMAPRTGLGWTLNAGGVVTRVVRGLPDDKSGAVYQNFLEFSQTNTYSYLTNGPNTKANALDLVVDGCADSEPDQFFFNFNGYTGKFGFDWDGNLVVSCSKAVKVKDIRDASNPNQRIAKILGWEITTEDGTIYKFNNAEQTDVRQPTGTGFGCQAPYTYISSWFLTEIADINNENKINFQYNPYQLSYILPKFWVRKHYFPGSGIVNAYSRWLFMTESITVDGGCPPSGAEETSGAMRYTYYGLNLKKITVSSGIQEVEFVSTNTRTDDTDILFGAPFGTTEYTTLDNIIVKSPINTEIKNYNLTYDYSTGKLTLKNITEKIAGSNVAPPYIFDYSSTQLPGGINSKAQDFWGFFNNANNSSMLPSYILEGIYASPVYIPGADRNANPATAEAGVLKRITYPLGGKVEFTYEPNDYSFVQNSIVSSLGEYTTTPYTNNVLAVGQPGNVRQTNSVTFTVTAIPAKPTEKRPVKFDYTAQSSAVTSGSKPWFKLFESGNSTPILSTFFNCNIEDNCSPQTHSLSFYKVLLPGTYTLEVSARVYNNGQGSDYVDATVSFDQPTNTPVTKKLVGGVRIRELKEFHATGNPNYSIKKYSYTMGGDPSVSSGVIYQEPVFLRRHAEMTEQVVNDNTVYISCDKIIAQSDNVTSLGTTQGSHIGYREVTITNGEGTVINGRSISKFTSPYDYQDIISIIVPFPPATSYSYKTGLLTEKADYVYDGVVTPKLAGKTIYEYYFKDYQVPSVKVSVIPGAPRGTGGIGSYQLGTYINIHGHSQVKREISILYNSTDYTTAVTTTKDYEYDAGMQNLKKITVSSPNGRSIITENFYPKDYTSPGALITFMKDKNFVGIPLETVSGQVQSSVQTVTNAQYSSYDNTGSILRFKKSYGLNTVTPIGTASFGYSINAAGGARDTRYDTKENVSADLYDDKGNILQVTDKAGIITSYIWGYNQQFPVAKVINKDYNTAISQSGLSLTLINTVSTTDAAMRTELNKLRNVAGAYVTTYTYNPLIGMTSETDPNGKTIFYEYDAMNRLKNIKDYNGNIVQNFCYNYAGNPTPCNLAAGVFYNVAISQPFTKNNCPPGQISTPVTYVVPAGKYSASTQEAADQLAWDDLNLNGQAYANANGTCRVALCNTTNCTGVDKKCVNDLCETGVRMNIASYMGSTGDWICEYRYRWSDGSLSQIYFEYSSTPCIGGGGGFGF